MKHRSRALFPLLLFSAFPLLAQPPAELPPANEATIVGGVVSQLRGTIYDADESPLPDAEVRVWRELSPEEAISARTDAEGRYVLPRLGAGKWRMLAVAPKHHAAIGHAVVPTDRVDVTLRPLSEVRTLGAESPRQIGDWLERGNVLLRQGFPAPARLEYLSALAALPAESQGEVLRTIAHTHFLERNFDAAAKTVRQALVRDPSDELSRRLLTVMLEDLDRGDEAREWLARLDAEGPEALIADLDMPKPGALFQMPPAPESPVLAAEPGRKGVFRTTFAQRSDLSDLDVFLKRYGMRRGEVLQSDPDAAAYDLADESFEVLVPEGYEHDPERPWGLMIWVSPTPWGGVRSLENREVLARERMIWVGADDSGNGRPSWDRIGLALDAAAAVQKLYEIDPQRLYVGGYSGGGRIATALALLYPEVFRGGFLAFGCNYYREARIPHQPGAIWPAAFKTPPRKSLKKLREETRLVFLTGENDFNRPQTRLYHRLYQDEGFRRAVYLEIPGGNHYSGIPAQWLEKVLEGLDD